MRILLAVAACLAVSTSALAANTPKEIRLGNIVVSEPFGRLAANRAILAEIAKNGSCRNAEFVVLPSPAHSYQGRSFHSFRSVWECKEPANTPEFDQIALVQYTFEGNSLSAPGNEVPSTSSRDLRLGFFSVRVMVLETQYVPR